MSLDHRRTAWSGATATRADRWKVGVLAGALAVSWASMVFHNLWELPLPLLAVENIGPFALDIALLVVCWRWPRSAVVWAVILAWGLLNMVVGGLLTVLPLPVLPFVPEQSVGHYAVHVVYAVGQLPLVLVAAGALRRLRHQKHGSGAKGDRDARADG